MGERGIERKKVQEERFKTSGTKCGENNGNTAEENGNGRWLGRGSMQGTEKGKRREKIGKSANEEGHRGDDKREGGVGGGGKGTDAE